jgi:hypothetical protein
VALDLNQQLEGMQAGEQVTAPAGGAGKIGELSQHPQKETAPGCPSVDLDAVGLVPVWSQRSLGGGKGLLLTDAREALGDRDTSMAGASPGEGVQWPWQGMGSPGGEAGP